MQKIRFLLVMNYEEKTFHLLIQSYIKELGWTPTFAQFIKITIFLEI